MGKRKLESCPFCDGEAELEKGKNKVKSVIYWVECLDCQAKITWQFNEDRAIQNWNTRNG